MNYNSNAGARPSFGRKIKRISDVNAMGYSPYEPNVPQQTAYVAPENVPQFPQPDYASSPYINQEIPPMNPQFQNPMQYNDNTPTLTPFKQPIVQDFALQYGQQLANAGTTILQNEVGKYVTVGKLKYYFSVDTKYVFSKLLLLFFPFRHSNWSVKYEQDSPVQPRFEINAPDLYIPMMAYITYILTAGLVLGTQNQFTFEKIGILSSSALAWCVAELLIYLGTLHLTMIQTSLRTLDLLAYSGYKFVGMIFCLTLSLVAGKTAYYCCLIYVNFALAFFLIRALKAQVLPESSPQENYYGGAGGPKAGNKRRLYFLLFVALTQPVLSWWLTYHLIGETKEI